MRQPPQDNFALLGFLLQLWPWQSIESTSLDLHFRHERPTVFFTLSPFYRCAIGSSDGPASAYGRLRQAAGGYARGTRRRRGLAQLTQFKGRRCEFAGT